MSQVVELPASGTVTAELDQAGERVLGHEERLAQAAAAVLRKAGSIAAKRFQEVAGAPLTAAGEGGWQIPHPNELIDVDAVVAGLRGKSDPIRRSAIDEYGAALSALHPELDWNLSNPLVDGALAGAAQHVTNIAETTQINLMRIVRRAYEDGLGIEDTAKAIREGMAEASQVRGRLIARTELAAVTNGGSLAATKLLADAGGGPYFKRWMTAPGAHYPRHEDYDGLDGQTVGLDDAFDVGGAALQFPGDPDGPPEEICNCRCTLAYVSSVDELIGGEPEGPPEMPAASEADVPLESVVGEDAEDLAAAVAANADAMEPYVTQAMRAAVEPLGGYLEGFGARQKSEESIARKITTDISRRIPGLPLQVAAGSIKDALRYTAVYRPGEYVTKMTQTLDALAQAGITAERVKAYWGRGEVYAGTNVVMKTPNGQRFEIQFHTPQSFHVKEHLQHADYEVWRKLPDKESPEARALWSRMVAQAEDVRRPVGIEDFRYDTHVSADVGITPFREGVDDPVGFYDSDKFKRFEQDARAFAERFGVELVEQERATGVWEGSEEPAVRFLVRDGESGVRAFGAALGRQYRQDGVAVFTPGTGDDVIARFSATPREPVAVAEGASIKDVVTNMGAHDLDVTPEWHPELFKEPVKLKGGGYAQGRNDLPAPRVKARADKSAYGLPPRIEDTVQKVLQEEVVPGSERPPEYLYRAISEEDYQASLERGYLKSDQRMNLADEGTVADFGDPSFYLPGKLASDADGVYGGRIVRIRYRDEDGWTLDHDGYAKTKGRIPTSQIDLVSPKIETVRSTAPDGGPRIETRVVQAQRLSPERVYEAMAAAELPAGRLLPDGGFEVIGSGPQFVKQLDRLAEDLGTRYDAELGRFDLLEAAAGEYERAISDSEGAGAVAPRAPGRAAGAPELAGRAAAPEGAGGTSEVTGLGLEARTGRTLSPDELDRLPYSPEDFNALPQVEAKGDRGAFDIIFGPDGISTQASLRVGDLPDWMPADLKVIDDTIAAQATPAAGTTVRGVLDVRDIFGDVNVGDVVFDPGYAPTTLDRRVAKRFAMGENGGEVVDPGYITYHLPKGAPALYENLVTRPSDAWADFAAGEYQLLLPRGQSLRVIGVDEIGGLANVHVELVDHPVSVPVSRPVAPLKAQQGKLVAPPDVSPPPPPQKFEPPYPPSEAARFGPDRLWGAHAEIGRLENAARAELPELGDDRLVDLLWTKGGKTRKGALSLEDLAGDQQTHTFFSDGHADVASMVEEALRRGEQRIVISDHSHLMTSGEIAEQHRQIDELNVKYRGKIEVLKGVEANILADGSLDLSPEELARFDVVNAAIHRPQEGPSGQLALFRESNTVRLLKAMDDPELDVLVHPHSVPADWDALAKKAAQKDVALEINGRDMLRNGRQEAAADMIDAARRHGAKLVIGSDAHTPGDLVDFVYAVRFASQHGVTRDDLPVWARAERMDVDPSSSIPRSFNASRPSAGERADYLGGGMNEVWKVETKDGRAFVVKPEPAEGYLEMQGFESGVPLRANVGMGADLERERAAYVVSRAFNEVGGTDYHVYVPPYRIGEFTRIPSYDGMPLAEEAETAPAGIAEFIPGVEGRSTSYWEDEVQADQLRAAALYDAVIGNTDRHAGNFLLGDDANLWLIDHGLSFPAGPAEDLNQEGVAQFQNHKLIDASERRTGYTLSDEEVDFLKRLRVRLRGDRELQDLISADELADVFQRIDDMIDFRNFDPAVLNTSEPEMLAERGNPWG